MAHIRSLIFACIVSIGAVASSFFESTLNVSRDVGNFLVSAFDYRPDANQSIALDVASRNLVDHRQPGIAARFASFIKNALTHDQFTADHYDPGWRPA